MHSPYIVEIPVVSLGLAQGSKLSACLVMCRHNSCFGSQDIYLFKIIGALAILH